MSEEKRPVLSLKRKPATDNAGANNNTGTPDVVVRRKKVVVVSTPPAWKVKKEKLEKKAAEAAARKTVPVMAKALKVPPPVRYLRLLPPEQAIMTLPNSGTLRITVSLGLAALNARDINLDQLFGEADVALYRAKQSGRNRTVISE